jgi:hypothetical protein
MIPSGDKGGNPVISKIGIETIAGSNCFTDSSAHNRNQSHQNEFGNVDISKIPKDILQEKIKLML